MTLKQAVEGKEYTIQKIETDDEEMDAFPVFLWDVIPVNRLPLSHHT